MLLLVVQLQSWWIDIQLRPAGLIRKMPCCKSCCESLLAAWACTDQGYMLNRVLTSIIRSIII